MFKFLLVVHAIIATALVAVILMQRSEGGGLASGGSPAGLVSARGAADLMTRTTAILASLFILLSITLAAVATMNRTPRELDTSMAKPANPGAAPAVTPAPAAPTPTVPLADAPAPTAAPAAKLAPEPAKPAAQPKVEAPRPAAKVEAVKAPAPKVEAPKATAPDPKPVETPAAPVTPQ